MDFAALPPEINSTSMYTGAGSGPMLAAAAAWDDLAEDLYSAATSYHSVISGLTSGPWLGAASAAMAVAATPNVVWMTTVASQAQQTAVQARMAVSAYETAFAMTVPPPMITANRSLLMALVATNFLGQNTPAIAATEAQYDAMWAQDAAAMYSYAANSASAATVPTFAAPQQTTSSAGLGGQAAAVSHATGTSAGANAQAVLSQLTAAAPQTLQSLSAPTATTSTSGLDSLTTLQPLMSASSSLGWITSAGLSNANQLKNLFPAASAAATGAAAADGLAPATSAVGAASLASVGSGGVDSTAAALGRAGTIGPLSVPQTWATGAAPISPTGLALALPSGGTSAAVGTTAPANMLGPVPMAPLAGRADPTPASATPRFDTRPSVVPRSPAAG